VNSLAIYFVRRSILFLLRLMFYIPLISLLLYGHYLYVVSEAVGHFPSYNNPDPKDVYEGYHNFHIMLWMLNIYLSIAVTFLMCFPSFRRIVQPGRMTIWLFVCGSVLYYYVFFSMVDWLLD